jgi:hypothetical protein
MDAHPQGLTSRMAREPWNKGKLVGQKPPLRPKHVWSIRTKLHLQGRVRDLAMFNRVSLRAGYISGLSEASCR